jgi:hypothetical protein
LGVPDTTLAFVIELVDNSKSVGRTAKASREHEVTPAGGQFAASQVKRTRTSR